jgi:trypsin-like peptidase
MVEATTSNVIGVRVLDLHLGVVAVRRKADGGIEAPKPLIYGTAFPILPGLFVTAGHVANDVQVDGIPGLVQVTSGRNIKVSEITQLEVFSGIDLALLECPGLKELVPLPLEFDRELTFLEPAYAIGYPYALDPEWVTVVPRGFRGHVVTRRELYQLRGQPPGYELSFHAPQGLSGAPVVSHVQGDHRCYGYVVQQATLGGGDEKAIVGVAVDIRVLLTVKTDLLGLGPLALAFGRDPVTPRAPSPVQLPGGRKPIPMNIEPWPDEED